jgi:hypothetical protein
MVPTCQAITSEGTSLSAVGAAIITSRSPLTLLRRLPPSAPRALAYGMDAVIVVLMDPGASVACLHIYSSLHTTTWSPAGLAPDTWVGASGAGVKLSA